MEQAQDKRSGDHHLTEDRQTVLRYAALTLVLFIPLLLAFVTVRNVYPFAASTMMLANVEAQSGRLYYVLRAETVTGETIDLPPIELTDALTGRNWNLAIAAVQNKSFRIRWPHPANTALTAAYGGVDKLPEAARLEELLRAWGEIYNSQLAGPSNPKLKSVQLDTYRWEGGIGGKYDQFVQSWKVSL